MLGAEVLTMERLVWDMVLCEQAAVVSDAMKRIFGIAFKLRAVYDNLTSETPNVLRADTAIVAVDTEFTRCHRFLLTILTTMLQKRSHSYCTLIPPLLPIHLLETVNENVCACERGCCVGVG